MHSRNLLLKLFSGVNLAKIQQHFPMVVFLFPPPPFFFLSHLVQLSLCKSNPAQLIRLKQSAVVQALHQMGHQTNPIELKGFLSQ